MLKIVNGDIRYARTKYIAHQCNCMTNKAAGVAKSIFDAFPYADIYSSRGFVDYRNRPADQQPGIIHIKGNGENQRFVINMMGQVFPGKPKFDNSPMDGSSVRESYFWRCLEQIAEIKDLTSIAFPYKIGCCLAGGNWTHYLKMLEMFAKKVDPVEVLIIKYD